MNANITRSLFSSIVLAIVVSLAAATPAAEFVEEGEVLEVIPGAPGPLELRECAGIALRSNPGLAQERAGLEEVGARAIQARSEGLPRFELQGAFSRSRDPSFALDESFGGSSEGGGDFFGQLLGPLYDQHPGLEPPEALGFSFIPDPADIPAQTFWRTYLDAYWELRPTRVYRAIRAAGSAYERQEALVADREHRTLESVVHAYHQVVLAREREAAIDREIEARREFLRLTRRRFQLELATALDTLQAAVSLANLEPEARRRAQETRRQAYALNELLGRDPRSPLSIVASFPLETEAVSESRALQLAQRRPDLRSEERTVGMLELQRGANAAQTHPYLTMEGQWGYVTRDLGELTNDGQDFWRVGVTLHVPLWDGQVTKGLVRQNEAELRRQHHRVEEKRHEVRSEVLLALESREVARADLRAAELNMTRAADAYQQVRRRYELGKADRLAVLDAQAERFTARTVLLDARYSLLATTATLKRALGVSPLQPLSSVLNDVSDVHDAASEDPR